MTPADIIVGKRYTSMFHGPKNVWLGCGRRKLWTDDVFEEKCLVLVESDNPDHLGRMMQNPENAQEGMWEALQDADAEDPTYLYVAS